MIKIKHNRLAIATLAAAILMVTMGAAHAATLSWNACSGEVTGYKVYYGTSASATNTSVTVGNVTSYSLNKLPLKENTTYYFTVSAYNSAGEGAKCKAISYTMGDATPPAVPSGLQQVK